MSRSVARKRTYRSSIFPSASCSTVAGVGFGTGPCPIVSINVQLRRIVPFDAIAVLPHILTLSPGLGWTNGVRVSL